MSNSIVNEKELLEILPALTRRQLRKLRSQNRLPYLKLGHRSFLYDPERVLEALRALEVNSHP
jgi:hypothetical protein